MSFRVEYYKDEIVDNFYTEAMKKYDDFSGFSWEKSTPNVLTT